MMKSNSLGFKRAGCILFISISLFILYSCAAQTWGTAIPNRKYHFPPSADPVKLHESTPKQAYIVVGEIQAHADILSTKDDVLEELKGQAARMGADAIVNMEYSERKNELFAKGLAIRWKQDDDDGFEFLEE